jgi:hypothetical protein
MGQKNDANGTRDLKCRGGATKKLARIRNEKIRDDKKINRVDIGIKNWRVREIKILAATK